MRTARRSTRSFRRGRMSATTMGPTSGRMRVGDEAMIKKTSKVMEQVAELGRLARGEMTPEVVKAVRKALDSSANRVVERATEIAADNRLLEMIAPMLAAFDRFLEDGSKTDKGCAAKTAIVKALNMLEHLGGDV